MEEYVLLEEMYIGDPCSTNDAQKYGSGLAFFTANVAQNGRGTSAEERRYKTQRIIALREFLDARVTGNVHDYRICV